MVFDPETGTANVLAQVSRRTLPPEDDCAVTSVQIHREAAEDSRFADYFALTDRRMTSRTKLAERLAPVANRSTLRLTHYGRKTGNPYEVTIWFVAADDMVYLATMNAARQWVRNVVKTPRVHLTIGDFEADGQVTRISAQRELGRAYELFVRKYWAMWLLDLVAKLLGRSPLTTKRVDPGRGAFFRVEL